MSWIPAAVAALAVLCIFFYPLTRSRMESIQKELAGKRGLTGETAVEKQEEATEADGRIWTGLPRVMRYILIILAVILILELVFVMVTGLQNPLS